MTKIFSLIWTIAVGAALALILALCSKILPDSPFQQFISSSSIGNFSQYFKFVFYFIPVGKMIAVMEAWVLVMTNWYTFRIIYKLVDHVISSMSSPFASLLK